VPDRSVDHVTGPTPNDALPTRRPSVGALAMLGQGIAGARTAEDIGDQCLGYLVAITGANRAAFGIADAGGAIQCVARHGSGGPKEDLALLEAAAESGPLSLTGHGLVDRGVSEGESIGSWVGVPMTAGDDVVGAISLVADPAGAFGPTALPAALAVAAQAAIALKNTQLLLALSEGKREWEQTVDAITDGICVLDARGTIRRANRAFCALADIPVTEVAGRPWVTLVPPAWAAGFEKVIGQPGASAELRAGNRLFLATALHLTQAGAASVVLVVSDQTEKRRLQEQLFQSEKMSAIGQLIAGVAHDLNNPLASVVGFADYLVEASDTTPAELVEPLRAIQQEAERAANIVKNLLNFARKQEGRRAVTPIGTILSATLLLLRNQLMGAKIETEVDVAPGTPDVCVDVGQIQQVFLNLVNNAAQAIEAGGVGSRIVVRAIPWLDGVAVTVEDDGPGVPPDLAQRVFEPFFTTKPTGEGTGLGLSICQGIVKEHGGRLALVASNRRGAIFQVELPAGQPAAPARPVTAAPPVHRLRILVVDDEPHIQHYMRATLEAWGHAVTVASNGRGGLEQALAAPFDVIISDLRMPELGGREMLEQLRAQQPAVADRVVISTGDTVRGDTLAFLESLGRPYLRKPFTLVELRAAIADAVRRASEQR
jgi:two-component system NtrC family sensor kinase